MNLCTLQREKIANMSDAFQDTVVGVLESVVLEPANLCTYIHWSAWIPTIGRLTTVCKSLAATSSLDRVMHLLQYLNLDQDAHLCEWINLFGKRNSCLLCKTISKHESPEPPPFEWIRDFFNDEMRRHHVVKEIQVFCENAKVPCVFTGGMLAYMRRRELVCASAQNNDRIWNPNDIDIFIELKPRSDIGLSASTVKECITVFLHQSMGYCQEDSLLLHNTYVDFQDTAFEDTGFNLETLEARTFQAAYDAYIKIVSENTEGLNSITRQMLVENLPSLLKYGWCSKTMPRKFSILTTQIWHHHLSKHPVNIIYVLRNPQFMADNFAETVVGEFDMLGLRHWGIANRHLPTWDFYPDKSSNNYNKDSTSINALVGKKLWISKGSLSAPWGNGANVFRRICKYAKYGFTF